MSTTELGQLVPAKFNFPSSSPYFLTLCWFLQSSFVYFPDLSNLSSDGQWFIEVSSALPIVVWWVARCAHCFERNLPILLKQYERLSFGWTIVIKDALLSSNPGRSHYHRTTYILTGTKITQALATIVSIRSVPLMYSWLQNSDRHPWPNSSPFCDSLVLRTI